MKVTYVDPVAEEVVVTEGPMPPGWFVPPVDISTQVHHEPLPHYTVVAFSSEASYKRAIKWRLGRKRYH